ncbi:flagellar hook-length control protein FliK [Thalassospira sp.]|uniref:flagellar hook-length control protein FliK n=1 Tax=Thalassospira sp. TaxID=1912094 RepID=UPI003AA86A55
MNSSAISNSVMPTVSIPGANASASTGSGFGDVMASITENWSEQGRQVKYDAAKSAQKSFDDNRADMNNRQSAYDDRNLDESRSADRSTSRDRNDDPASEDRRDITAEQSERDPASRDVDHADGNDSRDNDQSPDEQNNTSDTAASEDSTSNAATDETATSEAVVEDTTGQVDPNQPVQAVPAPGSPEALELAKANAAAMKTAATGSATAGQNGAQTPEANAANTAPSTDTTTDGLMNSTALSQPAAASSAKAALNGAEAGNSDDLSSDQFLSRVVDSMSGDSKAKTDTVNTVNGAPTNQTNGSQQQANGANAGNPAQNAQTAQQAMAAAAQAANMPNNPTASQNTAVNGAVTATGGTEAVATANGQPGSTSSLQQTNTGGQTAQTARQAPTQQIQQQVAVSIRNAASEGVDKISVQLRPEHLGRVDVKMEIGQDGRIQGVIQADTRETLDMLRQDSRALQQALKDAGLNADSQSFTFEHRNEGGQSQEGNGQSRMTANQGSSPDEGDVMSGTELAEHVAIGYGINPNGLVDIRI